MTEQIRLDGRPEKPKQTPPEVKYREGDNKVEKVTVSAEGFDVNVWFKPDGEIARTNAYPVSMGRAPSEFEVPKYIIEKAIAQAVAIYKSHERTKDRAEKKEQAAKQQRDLDFGEEDSGGS